MDPSLVDSTAQVACVVVQNNLSLILFPEGTRSKTGRLLPFKKRFVHTSLQTKLPVISIVLTGTHLAWRKNSLKVSPAPLTVKILLPTKNRRLARREDRRVCGMVHSLYVENLCDSQKPLEPLVPERRGATKKSLVKYVGMKQIAMHCINICSRGSY